MSTTEGPWIVTRNARGFYVINEETGACDFIGSQRFKARAEAKRRNAAHDAPAPATTGMSERDLEYFDHDEGAFFHDLDCACECDQCAAAFDAALIAQEARIERTYAHPFVQGVAAFALALGLLLPAATQAQERAPDPRIAATIAYQSTRYPAPDGCTIQGGWDDGSLVSSCADGVWLSHGPDADDTWSVYQGDLLPAWEERS